MQEAFSRRAIGARLIGAGLSSPAIIRATEAFAAPETADLARYFAFVWHEHEALAAELGCSSWNIDMFRLGNLDALSARLKAPPSSRCLPVLRAAGATRAVIS